MDPLAAMRQERGAILLETIGEEQRYAAWRQDLDALMDHMLRHRQRAVADVNGPQQLAHRVERSPPPVR